MQRGAVTLMRVMPSASLGTLPVISSQMRCMNWWGMTNTSRSASFTASPRLATATCKGKNDAVTPGLKHTRPSNACADSAPGALVVPEDSQAGAVCSAFLTQYRHVMLAVGSCLCLPARQMSYPLPTSGSPFP